MKKLLVLTLVLLTAATSFAIGNSAYNYKSTFGNGYAFSGHTAKDNALKWAQDVEDLTVLGSNLGTGSVYYVDSNVSTEGDGSSWEKAKDDINTAIGLCTANNGDFILVAQGFNEALTTASDIVCDVAGVTIIGIGNGSLKPTLDYDAAAAEFYIGAANVTIENIRFRASANAGVQAIAVAAAGDSFSIIGCEFGWAETATDEFANAIIIAEGADEGAITGCTFKAGAQAAVTAVTFSTVSGITIADNMITGDYSTSVLNNTKEADDVIVANNILYNGNMAGDGGLNSEPAIEFADATSGLIVDNRIGSDVATALLMRVADDCTFIGNLVTDTDGDEFGGSTPYTVGGSVAAHSVASHVDG